MIRSRRGRFLAIPTENAPRKGTDGRRISPSTFPEHRFDPLHEVYLPKPKLAVEGPGGVQASFDFRGAKNDAAGRMLTVTLTNDLDGLVYG